MNRRDLLKLFGVGATIAPLAASGLLVPNVQAKLIEEPKVDIQVVPSLPAAELFSAAASRRVYEMEIILTDKEKGQRMHFSTDTYLTDFSFNLSNPSWVEVTTIEGYRDRREYLPARQTEWTMHGVTVEKQTTTVYDKSVEVFGQ